MRLSKIYTRTGDHGKTRLAQGEEVSKDSQRVTAYGEIDELNSHLGLVIALNPDPTVSEALTSVQQHLFDVGGELASPGMINGMITHGMITELENEIDKINGHLPDLEEFILPGGTIIAAQLHLARTVCRRAERRIITLKRSETVSPELISYINRLSDLLFVMARYENNRSGNHEIYWKNPLKK
ncbi:cob(I)yrinic acid a,c-diamide adenosyltransferase [bacterium]|nr:cob(I)yrinic acid a,c-diamide adenosyltransferase [bacterium]